MVTFEQATDLSASFRGAGYQTVTDVVFDGYRIRVGGLPTAHVDAVVLREDGAVLFVHDSADVTIAAFDDFAGESHRDIVTAYIEEAMAV